VVVVVVLATLQRQILLLLLWRRLKVPTRLKLASAHRVQSGRAGLCYRQRTRLEILKAR
jgi:hypothetical protein